MGISEETVGEGDRDSARGGVGVIVSGKSPSTVPCAECFDHPCVCVSVCECVCVCVCMCVCMCVCFY